MIFALNFFEKFFGYYFVNGSYSPYSDGMGKGAFSDYRHFLWMVVIIVIGVAVFQLFKRNKQAGNTTAMIMAFVLFSVRLINQIVRAGIGAEVPAWRAFPFHLCTVMTFVLPIVLLTSKFFNSRVSEILKTPVYVIAMMGGIITIIVGDYFDNGFLTFSDFEGMWAHSALILIPIIEMATGNFKLEIKKVWQVFCGMAVLIIWGTLANEVFFRDIDTNYMYLKQNGLPGNLGGDFYLLIYTAVFLLLLAGIYFLPILYKKLFKKKEIN